jgi:hypothetical protein
LLPSGKDWSSLHEQSELMLRATRDALAPDARHAVETDFSVPRALERVVRRQHRDLLLVGSSPRRPRRSRTDRQTYTTTTRRPTGRERESLLTLADGGLGTRGTMLVSIQTGPPSVLLSGVYTGAGPETQLLAGAEWNSIEIADHADLSTRRVLDLRTGTLSHELAG